jgi:hypothetical protein
MAQTTIDHTNNNIREVVRGTALGVFDLMNNTYSSGLIPTHSSRRSTGEYWRYDKRYFLSTQVAKRTPGTVNPTAKYAAGTQLYKIDQFGLRVPITDEEIAEAQDPLQPLADATKFLTHNFIVDYELDWNNTFMDDDAWALQAQGTTSYANGDESPIGGNVTQSVGSNLKNDGSGSGVFLAFDQAASDPIRIFLSAMRAMQLRTGLRPNRLVIPRLVLDALRDNDAIKEWADAITSVHGGDEETLQILSVNLGLPTSAMHVVEMVYQDITDITYTDRDSQNYNFGQAGEPTFGDMEWVMEKSCLMYYNGDWMGKFTKTAAVCHKWDGLMSTISGESGFSPANTGVDTGNLMMRSYYHKENLTHYVDGLFAYDNDIVAPELGFFFKDCIEASAGVA